MMKKAILAALAALLAWNILLTVRVFKYTTVGTDNRTVIQNTVNGYTTDISEAADAAKASLVSVLQGAHRGSGVIISSDKDTAYIVTAAQGLQANGSAAIEFDNGITIEGKILGEDNDTGLALISIVPGFDVTALQLGDSSLISPGETVIVMGGRRSNDSALITSGTLSAPLQMELNSGTGWIANLLEADCSVNDDNIGGAMMNLSGELLGIAISKPMDGQMEMGYAVSVNEMKNVYTELKNTGTISRGNLGVTARSIEKMNSYEKSANSISLDMTSGVMISGILTGSSADGALHIGDLLTKIDEKKLLNEEELHTILFNHVAGDVLNLTVSRDGTEQQIAVTLK
jgi:S1-C subfamily serine protease